MKNIKELSFSFLFLAILICDIVLNSSDHLHSFRIITKPLITISLILFYYMNSSQRQKKERETIIIALFFLLIGDMFLLEESRFYHFSLGFIAFLLANITYSYLLYRSAHNEVKKSIPFLIIVVIYFLVVYYLIYDKIQGNFIPVTVYLFAVLNMMQSACLRHKVVNNKSFYLVFTGALLFMISQNIFAINMFYKPVPYKDILIILFYGLSQLLIVQGILVEQKKFRRF
ncbi:hypothetical protein GTQ40_04480 [Flavobacteriaceae bacterium R38]|nr:hypothetical protein [Flavobacteriaceae bacterium R38]